MYYLITLTNPHNAEHINIMKTCYTVRNTHIYLKRTGIKIC